jgi:hypothetical protein
MGASLAAEAALYSGGQPQDAVGPFGWQSGLLFFIGTAACNACPSHRQWRARNSEVRTPSKILFRGPVGDVSVLSLSCNFLGRGVRGHGGLIGRYEVFKSWLVSLRTRRISPVTGFVLPAHHDPFRVPAQTRSHARRAISQSQPATSFARLICFRSMQ